MKQIFTLGLAMMLSFAAFAQLGAPKTTVKDTLNILSVSYNGTLLDIQDWPARYIVEDPVYIYIANYKYKKNKPTYKETKHYDSSWGGHIDFIAYGDAVCNGKKQSILIVHPYEDCSLNYVDKYVIGDYDFMVLTDLSRLYNSIEK